MVRQNDPDFPAPRYTYLYTDEDGHRWYFDTEMVPNTYCSVEYLAGKKEEED